MSCTGRVAAESRREEEVLHVDDYKSCFARIESYGLGGSGKGEARVDGRGCWSGRVRQVEAGGGVMEPEV